jgi:peroxiredoxin
MNTLREIFGNRLIQGALIFVLAMLVAMGVGALQGGNNVAGVEVSGLEVAPIPGSLAPDFTLTTVDGDILSLRQFRGKTVLVNFWATWCGPCRIEMPAIQSRFEQLKDEGFVVLAVDFDESQQTVDSFRDEVALTFDLLLDPGAEVQKLYRNRSYPASFFIDPQGVIQIQHIGVMTEGQLDRYLEQLGFNV